MSGAAFMRVKKLKGNGIIIAAARHNRREIQAELGATGSIDPARSHLNETIHGPGTADGVAQLAKNLMRETGVVKFRKDAVMGLEFIFSLPAGHQLDERAYFADCARWVAGLHGEGNILSVDIHRDEAAPHCHVLLLPLLDGKLAGSAMVGGKQKLAATHKHFHDAVASRHGLRKAPARQAGASKQAAAAAVLEKLRNTSDAALQSAAWPAMREAIEADPQPFLLALGIVAAPVKKKPLRTMTQIFTSTGKGPAKEKPIGFAQKQPPPAPPEPEPAPAEPHAPPLPIQSPEKKQTLCSVGFTPKKSIPATPKAPRPPPARPAPPLPTRPPEPAHADRRQASQDDATATNAPPEPAPAFTESARVRDNDIDAARYDPTTGEFFNRPQPARRNRSATDDWVAQKLVKKKAKLAKVEKAKPGKARHTHAHPDKTDDSIAGESHCRIARRLHGKAPEIKTLFGSM